MEDKFFLYDLTDRLPYFMQSEEGMKIAMDLINLRLNDVKPLIDNMPDLMDYDTVRTEFLPILASLLSYEYKFTEDKLYQADLIRQLLPSFSMKGNNEDIITTVDSYDNSGWLAGEYFYPKYWREYKATYIETNVDRVFRHNISKHSGGHRFQDGDKWWYGVITINTVDYLNDILKEYLDKVVPAGVKYTVNPFTDIVGPNGELLYLGAYTTDSIVQQISQYDMILDYPAIPKTIPQSVRGLTLIHSDRHKNFTTSYNPDTNPVYVGTYTSYEEENPINPYLYTWEELLSQTVPEEAYNGKGVPIQLGDKTAYEHYAFCDYVTGRLHSGGYVTADNVTNIDIHLEQDFTEFLLVNNYHTDMYVDQTYLLSGIILVSDAIEYISSLEWYNVAGRYASNFKSNESVKHIMDSLPNMSTTFGLDGFEVSSDGTYQHIAYADNALGSEGFSLDDSNKNYVGTYWDDTTIPSQDPQRYAWVYVPIQQ